MTTPPFKINFKDLAATSAICLILFVPMLGVFIDVSGIKEVITFRGDLVIYCTLALVLGRLSIQYLRHTFPAKAKKNTLAVTSKSNFRKKAFIYGLVLLAIAMPMLPWSDRLLIDRLTFLLIYIMLGWGLNIVVGLAGLLDLGYVAFYAVGAYSFALLAQNYGLSFWICLPLAGILSAFFGVLLGFPILRLRGDYLAIVTLGFGEIVRIIILATPAFGTSKGISGIPRPTFFGSPLTNSPAEGVVPFHELFGLEYSSMHRIIYLYYIILMLALLTNWFTSRLRNLPIGRAWEAMRENEVACQSIGLNPVNTKLTAFAIGAMFAGFAGSFFATRQGFISPESFTFIESAIMVGIVVLGGMGSQLGVVLAAAFLVLLPEYSRSFESFRMMAFGAAMVAVMVWKPKGFIGVRTPTARLYPEGHTPEIDIKSEAL